MRIGIVGSRNFVDEEKIRDLVNSLDKEDVVVSGGAKGVDSLAVKCAEKRGLKTIVIRPEISNFNRTWDKIVDAYHERNKKIVENSDIIHAFVAGSKGGTWNTVKWAKQLKKEVIIHK